jgi:hypothetical protein
MDEEPSREDRYEAAVRAVLDLCDEQEELYRERGLPGPMVFTGRIRDAIREQLRDERADG